MKVTFILKNLTDAFYAKIPNETEEAFNYLDNLSKKPEWGISRKIETGSFNDGVKFNMMRKNGKTAKQFKLESRKGYKLAIFIF